MAKSGTLAQLGNAQRALAAASTLEDVLSIRDQAEALRVYVKAAGEGFEAANAASEFKLNAERKAGGMLKAMENRGRPRKGNTMLPFSLDDLGISRMQSSRWQAVASFPEAEFSAYLEHCKEHHKEVTQAGLLAMWKAAEKEKKKKKLAKQAEQAEAAQAKRGRKVEAGSVWQLGRHILYCGDTSKKGFQKLLTEKAALAFADPPYGAGKDGYDDSAFYWKHDYLIDHASTVAVTPGIVSIFKLAQMTEMPYVWSGACWISNGMTRGAMGFGNWIYTAIFSHESIHNNAQDFCKVSISNAETADTTHTTRKPTAYMQWVMKSFTDKDDLVIDPFLGSGQTLIVAEAMGRRCIGGELDPKFCGKIISRWEQQTKQKAEVVK